MNTYPSMSENLLPAAPRLLVLAQLPIGDTLFTFPTIAALRRRYPRAWITALTYTNTLPLLRCLEALDDVVVLPFASEWAGMRRFVETLASLRERHFDVAINLTTPAYLWVSWVCGIPLHTSMKFDPLWWLLPGQHKQWWATHATAHFYDCARELDLPPWEEVSHQIELHLPQTATASAAAFLRSHDSGSGRGPLIGLHPGGAGLNGVKRWPAARFAALASALVEWWDARIVLLGGPDDADLSQEIAATMRGKPILAAGQVPLLTSMALITSCDLFVGNDSSLLHAAAALGRPYVGIYGPTNVANFHPIDKYRDQGIVIQPLSSCLTPYPFVGGAPVWSRPCCQRTCRALCSISIDRVLAAANTLLNKRHVTFNAHRITYPPA